MEANVTAIDPITVRRASRADVAVIVAMLADAVAAAVGGDAHVLDQAARGALRA